MLCQLSVAYIDVVSVAYIDDVGGGVVWGEGLVLTVAICSMPEDTDCTLCAHLRLVWQVGGIMGIGGSIAFSM